MLVSEEGQLNAVYACFGSAAQHSYFFEAALGKFLQVYNKISNRIIKLQDLEINGRKIKTQNKTMGQLLIEFRKYVTIQDNSVDRFLDNVLKKRNFLIHNFFRQRQKKFRTEKGRMEMLKELLGIQNELERATALTNGMRVALSRAINLKNKNQDKNGDERNPASEVLFEMIVNLPE